MVRIKVVKKSQLVSGVLIALAVLASADMRMADVARRCG